MAVNIERYSKQKEIQIKIKNNNQSTEMNSQSFKMSHFFKKHSMLSI